MDSGDAAKAAATFRDLLGNADALASLSPANLSYIIDAGFKANALDVSGTAAKRLLELAGTPATAKDIPNSIRDKALLRLAAADLSQGQPMDAIRNIERLIKLNPKTAYFYEAKFLSAEAYEKCTPPDYSGAIRELEAILQYATDQAVTDKARCLIGDAYTAAGQQDKARGPYQLVALLGNPDNEAARPWVERAMYAYAKILNGEGATEDLRSLLERYAKAFPEGEHLGTIRQLAQ